MMSPIEPLTKETENIQADINEMYANVDGVFRFPAHTGGLPFIKSATSTQGHCSVAYDGRNKVITVDHDKYKGEVVIGYGQHLQGMCYTRPNKTSYNEVLRLVARAINTADDHNLWWTVNEIKSPIQHLGIGNIRDYRVSKHAEILSIDYCALVPFDRKSVDSIARVVVSPQSGIHYQVLIIDRGIEGSLQISATSFIKFKAVTEYGLGAILEVHDENI